MFLDVIERNCLLFKDRPAYICEGQVLSYGELWFRACSLAAFLRSDGVTPVIVYGHKNPLMIISFVACLLSGRTYVPCDTSIPAARIKHFCESTRAGIILATEDIQGLSLPIIGKDDLTVLCEHSHKKPVLTRADFYAYIIFTSGSTGVPKGVPISMRNLEHFISWVTKIPEISVAKKCVVLNQALFSFDLSVADIYISLIQGNTLFALTKKEQGDFPALFKRLGESNCGLIVCTPTFMQMCLCDSLFNNAFLPCLKTVFFCGEVLPVVIAKRLLDRFPDIAIINAYGPTESCCAVSVVSVTRDMLSQKSLPIGETDNSAVLITVVDENKRAVADGSLGEIMLCGDSVSDGYIDSIHGYFEKVDGRNAYLTGDIGMIVNGLLYFNGRKDNQIKYKGYRIDLTEIEAVLQVSLGYCRVTVLPVHDGNGRIISLSAVIENAGEPFPPEEITARLSELLPEYMIPRKFIQIPVFPMTANGKCDRTYLEELVNNGKNDKEAACRGL